MIDLKKMSKMEICRLEGKYDYSKYTANDHEDPRYYDQETDMPIALLPNAPKEALETFERMKEIWAEEERTGIISD